MSRYKYVSCDVLIPRIARIFKFNSNEWVVDFYEDIYEVTELIGIANMYEKVFKTVEVKDYRVELPCNLKYLRAIGYNGNKINVSNVVAHNHGGLQIKDTNVGTYSLDAGHLHTPFKEGKVTLYYYRVPFQDGKIMIPDNAKVKIACTWYVVTNILAGGASHPVFTYETANNSFREWLPQAQNSVSFPTPDEMERIRLNSSMLLLDNTVDEMFNNHN